MTEATQSVWDSHPDICNALLDLWPTNSATQCTEKLTERFGVVVTRSAVIAKAHRMGLANTPKALDRAVTPRVPWPVVEEVSELPSLDLTLDELTADNCRFIAGDPREARYCGRQVHKHGFCAAHFRICYQNPLSR
jgi:hypothetical protein